tara:strand:- start:5330 stop:6190 length:861 start_codon:yes stop_codon:yes gene_type:complete
MKISESLTYIILIFIKKWMSSLSAYGRYRLSIWLASYIYHYTPTRKEIAFNNIKKAFPEWNNDKINHHIQITYQFFTHNMIQFFSVPKSWHGIEIEIIGSNILDEAMKNKKGCILVSAHFGAWELFVKWVGQTGYDAIGIAQRQKNKGANQFFKEQRELCNVEHIFRKESIDKMESVLNSNKILGLVSDQDARNRGIFVDFFGHPASTHKGAALFHKNTNAPLVFGVCLKTGYQKYRVEIISIKPKSNSIKDITQAFTSIIEAKVREYPEQYFWFHRRWKTKQIIQ